MSLNCECVDPGSNCIYDCRIRSALRPSLTLHSDEDFTVPAVLHKAHDPRVESEQRQWQDWKCSQHLSFTKPVYSDLPGLHSLPHLLHAEISQRPVDIRKPREAAECVSDVSQPARCVRQRQNLGT